MQLGGCLCESVYNWGDVSVSLCAVGGMSLCAVGGMSL